MQRLDYDHHTSSNVRVAPPLALLAAVLLAAISVRAADGPKVYTDKRAYNAGEEVRVAIAREGSEKGNLTYRATLRYLGNSKPLMVGVTLPDAGSADGYRDLWKIPPDAKTGRYEIELMRFSGQASQGGSIEPLRASFSVYRKLVEVERMKLGQTFYTSGDAVSCAVTLENRTDHSLENLRVEFSDRYWPWIGTPAANVAATVKPLTENLSLKTGETRQLESANCATAPEVKKASTHQYGVVVWDHDRKNVYDIYFSELTFVRPRGSDEPTPYPGQYTYPDLSKVDTTDYRQFYPPELNSGAVVFDTTHTMFPLGGVAEIHFAFKNPTDAPWRGVTAQTRWIGPDGKEVARDVLDKTLDLIPGADPVPGSATLRKLETAGLYRARVQIINNFGQVLGTNDLEFAVNPLPRSILIFCGHEDDEGSWNGLTRAAIENHIPIHFVYFTGGDAGSCDRYYQHSCGPAEAENFGEIRMAESRATLGHLGVPRDDIFFLGLPDGGSGEIWYDHVESPYLSVLLASDHTPYPDAAIPNLAFARQPVVEAAEEFIKRFQPEVIVTAHPPQQTHIDHMVNNYFVVKALDELLKTNSVSPETQVLVDRVYDPKDSPKTPYRYEEREFFISGEVATQSQEAWWFYQSQGGNTAQGHIRDFEKLPRSEKHRVVLDWKEHEGWNDKLPALGAAEQ